MDKSFPVPVERATEVKEDFLNSIIEFSGKNNCLLVDGRLFVSNGLYAGALNGNSKGASKDYAADIGVRVYAGKIPAMGFAGCSLGKNDFENIKSVAKKILVKALKLAKANSKEKGKAVKDAKKARGIYELKLAEIPVSKKEWVKKWKKNPLEAHLEYFIKESEKISASLKEISGVASNAVSIFSMVEKRVFASSEGSLIEQTNAITEPSVFIAAKGNSQETYHEWIAEQKGLEALEGDNAHGKTFEDFCQYIAEGTVELANAPAVPSVQGATIVSNPWFNTLLSHEICGHPCEADRALKRETAWAGRAWWFRGMDDNEIGKPVGSEEMTVISDPTIDGYGNYMFDDEGTPAKAVVNIEKGVLKGFMNSRETSKILNEVPNGHMRASSALMVPLIRMSNTYFAKGTWKAEELIQDTKKGFYVLGQKTPSIGESRQNFNITCWKIFEINNGEIGKLYRNGGIEGNSREMFMTMEAAEDVKIYNVPNCGKGTPMQTMRVGNGGPHLRFKANVSGKRD